MDGRPSLILTTARKAGGSLSAGQLGAGPVSLASPTASPTAPLPTASGPASLHTSP